MIALVPGCKHSKEMKAQGALVIQPSIALANIATRMALLDPKSAEALSNEISTTSDFSTASYFLRDDRDVADMRLDGRHLALGRNVENHHSMNYDRFAQVFAAEGLPMPPLPFRVAMLVRQVQTMTHSRPTQTTSQNALLHTTAKKLAALSDLYVR
ncbi:unnamed protein product [Peronospora destructor]|nr:unnamed protein product [Peronospora destructor]